MKATLLLVPGMLNTAAVFDRALAQARGLWRDRGPDVLVADLRSGETIDSMADAAWQLAAAVPAGSPLVVAGYSLGGYVAMQMLASAPRAVQGLGLICTSARADTPEGETVRQRAIAAMERDFERYIGSMVSFMLSPAGQADAALVAELRADMLAVGATTAIRQQRAAAARPDRRDWLRALPPGLPVQVTGGSNDPVTPASASQEMAALAPGAELHLVEGAGHLLPLEHPAALAAQWQRLLQRAGAGPD